MLNTHIVKGDLVHQCRHQVAPKENPSLGGPSGRAISEGRSPRPRLPLGLSASANGSPTLWLASGGDINIHWAVLQLPPSLVDYVLVHELAHLREANHTPEFWSIVARLMPGCLAHTG